MIPSSSYNITAEFHQKVCEENALLQKINSEQAIKISSLELQILELRKWIIGFKRETFKASPELPAGQAVLFDTEPLATIENTPEIKTVTINNFKIKPNPKKHNGRNPIPDNIRREEEVVEPQEIVAGSKRIGEEITEVLEYKSAEIFVRKIIRPKYALPGGEGVIIAPAVDTAFPKSIAGPGLIANIIIEKFVDHLPIYRQVERFKRLNIELDESTIGGWLKTAHRLLIPIYEALKKEVLQSNYLQADESTIKVLDKEKKGTTHLGYYWLYHDSIRKIIWYDYHKSRGREAPDLMLDNFSGYLQTDGYAAYEHFDKDPNITHLCCMAHARRKFFDAQENDATRATYFLEKMHVLYTLERELKDLTDEERLEKRITKAQPVLSEIKTWLLAEVMQVTPTSPIGKAINYSLARWEKLSIYATTHFLNIDNNLIENKVRPLAIGRKNYLFAGSHEAATRNGMLYSILVTCKLNNINPHKYLTHLFNNLPSQPINKIADLLPHKINPEIFW